MLSLIRDTALTFVVGSSIAVFGTLAYLVINGKTDRVGPAMIIIGIVWCSSLVTAVCVQLAMDRKERDTFKYYKNDK